MSFLSLRYARLCLIGSLLFPNFSRAALPEGPGDGRIKNMVLVPAGLFLRGDDSSEADERPRRRIYVSAFHIDRTEVTRGDYAPCVAAGKCHAPRAVDLHDPAGQHLPVVNVSHEDATAYCAYAGKRLPTEAEWEKAARGADGRRYPWGDDLSCSRGNFGNFRDDGRCAAAGAPGRPVAVGRYPTGASPYGALDLAGNVWEWVADRYAADGYQRSADRDPRGPEQTDGPALRVVRGGGCCSIFGLPRASDRLALPATYRDVDIGFRCAR